LVMGFEHGLSFTPPLDSSTLARLLTHLKSPQVWPLVRAEQHGETYVLRYTHSAGVPPVWEEDFLVDVSDQKLYLLLHTAKGDQEQAVLGWLHHCLHTSGLPTAELQEL